MSEITSEVQNALDIIKEALKEKDQTPEVEEQISDIEKIEEYLKKED